MPGVVVPAVSVPVHEPLSAMVLIPVTDAVAAPLLQLVAAAAVVVHGSTGVDPAEGATPGDPVTMLQVTIWPKLLTVWMRRLEIDVQEDGTKL